MRQTAVKRSRILLAHIGAVGCIGITVNENVRTDGTNVLTDPAPMLGLGLSLKFQVTPVGRILHIFPFGKLHAVTLAEQIAAIFTVTDAVINAGIIAGLIPCHIKVNSIDRKFHQCLAQNLQHIFALKTAVDTGMDISVIVDDFPLRRAIGPFRVLLVDFTANFGKVCTCNNTDPLSVTDVDHLFHAVCLQIGALRMVLQFSRVACQNAGCVDHRNRGVTFFQFPHIGFCIHIEHVNLTQIGLYVSPGYVFPPVFHDYLPVYTSILYFTGKYAESQLRDRHKERRDEKDCCHAAVKTPKEAELFVPPPVKCTVSENVRPPLSDCFKGNIIRSCKILSGGTGIAINGKAITAIKGRLVNPLHFGGEAGVGERRTVCKSGAANF